MSWTNDQGMPIYLRITDILIISCVVVGLWQAIRQKRVLLMKNVRLCRKR